MQVRVVQRTTRALLEATGGRWRSLLHMLLDSTVVVHTMYSERRKEVEMVSEEYMNRKIRKQRSC